MLQEMKRYLEVVANIMQENKETLIEMDQIVGDGDLGLTMSDGFRAAYLAIKDTDEQDLGKLVYAGGKAMASAVPSTMGTLMASGLMQAGKDLRNQNKLTNENWVQFFSSFEAGVINRGKANVGEKTFVDGIDPAVQVLKENIELPLAQLASKASKAARQGYKQTATMIAKHGRAATRGEASRDLLDPGAYVAVLLFEAFEISVKG